MRFRFAALILLVGLVACARLPFERSPSTSKQLDQLLEAAEIDGSLTAALVVEASSGRVVYARHPQRRLIPASTVKVLSTAAALRTFGPDWRYRTPVRLEGVQEGELFRGDLVVTASGDPSLGSWRWPETEEDSLCNAIAARMAELGIRRLEGRVRIEQDPSMTTPSYGPGWAWDDAAYDFSATPAAFSFRENTVELFVSRRGDSPCGAPLAEVKPAGGSPSLEVQVETTDAGRSLACRPEDLSIRCTWSHPSTDCPRRGWMRLASRDPPGLFAGCVDRALRRSGIERTDPSAETDLNGEPIELLAFESPPLSELVKVTNKDSLNLYAERLALLVAHAWTGREDYDALRSTWSTLLALDGIAPSDLRPVDGSGLSRYNLATPRGLVALLSAGLASTHGEVLRESLAIAGEDGTLRKLTLSQAATGRVRAKTGGMSGQRAFVGTLERVDGTTLHFALMLGNLASPLYEANGIFREFAEILVTAGR